MREHVEHLRLHVEPVAGAAELVEARVELVVAEGVDHADGRGDGHVSAPARDGRSGGSIGVEVAAGATVARPIRRGKRALPPGPTARATPQMPSSCVSQITDIDGLGR